MADINEKIICAGFGGQGIMVMGKVIAEAAMLKNFNVTWLPAYGAEVRGGTAYSMVHISAKRVANPVVYEATAAILMNGPSYERFRGVVSPGGLVVVNTSLVEGDIDGEGLEVAACPITDEAIKLGNVKVANVVAAGIYASRGQLFDRDVLVEVIKIMAGEKKQLIPINIAALDRGMEIGRRANCRA